MTPKRVNAPEAKALTLDEGYTLVDVRSIPEFRDEHAEGALNIPFLHKSQHGMVPNQEFLAVIEAVFPDRSQKLLTYCQMGGRSVRAAQELVSRGYTNVVDLRGGFGGECDEAGRVLVPGWRDSGLPTERGDTDGRSYRDLHARAAGHAPPSALAGSPPEAVQAATPPNRFAHPTRTVRCVKLGRTLPSLKRRPVGGPLGERLFAEVSADAWLLWVDHSRMIINEYQMNPADPRAQELLLEQCEQFFFGPGVPPPEEYVPPSAHE